MIEEIKTYEERQKELIAKMNEFLAPIKERRKKYEENPELVKQILQKGTNEAREKAIERMKEVKKAIKIDY